MAIVSYRIYCSECNNDSVIKQGEIEETYWTVNSWHYHDGLCPSCNPRLDVESDDDFDDSDFEVDFTQLRGIGPGTQDNLHDAGIITRGDVREKSDEELRSISGVGKTSLESIRDEIA